MKKILLILIFVTFCTKSDNSVYDESLVVLIKSLADKSVSSCANSANLSPSFAQIVQDGHLSTCYTCHDGTMGPACPTSDLNVYDYDSIMVKVVKGYPEKSYLYITAAQGEMSAYSNPETNKILFDWIENCAPR